MRVHCETFIFQVYILSTPLVTEISGRLVSVAQHIGNTTTLQ